MGLFQTQSRRGPSQLPGVLMHLELPYVTRFLYPSPVWDSHNALRAKPAEDEYQDLLSYSLEISPPTSVFTYVDNRGTEVQEFSIADEHSELVVSASAAVETRARPAPGAGMDESIDGSDFRESNWIHLQPSKHAAGATQWHVPPSRWHL